MATSGSFTFKLNALEIIRDALIESTVIQDNQRIEGGMYDWMLRRLNVILKSFQTKGMHLWKVKEVTLLMEKDKIEYTLGPGGDRASESVIRSITTTVTSSGATTVDCVSTGMTVGDVVIMEMDDATAHATTIATIPDAASITLTDVTDDTAAIGNIVYTYTSLIEKPLRLLEGYVIQKGNEDAHVPLNVIPREEYMRLNNKETASYPVSLYFNPERLTSKLKIWPVSVNNVARIVMTFDMPIDDMNVATDDLAMPDWWYEALHLKLAHAAARSYMVPIDKVRELKSDAKEAISEAEDYGVETTYIQIIPEVRYS